MRTVYKYNIPTSDVFELQLPRGAKPLSVEVQMERMCMWVEVSTEEPLEPRTFRICGTGHGIPAAEWHEFIGTLFLDGGALVFHVFEIKSVERDGHELLG